MRYWYTRRRINENDGTSRLLEIFSCHPQISNVARQIDSRYSFVLLALVLDVGCFEEEMDDVFCHFGVAGGAVAVFRSMASERERLRSSVR